MKRIVTTLVVAAAIALVTVPAFADSPEIANAATVYLQKGEGGAGLDAWLEMDEANQLTLFMGCQSSSDRRRMTIQLGLYPGKNASSELRKLWPEDVSEAANGQKLNLFVCLNSICEEREWEFLASGFGDTFFTTFVLNRTHSPIRVVRVILPKEPMRYEYRGDLEDILLKICRR
jgi:hypothetical protein